MSSKGMGKGGGGMKGGRIVTGCGSGTNPESSDMIGRVGAFSGKEGSSSRHECV